MYLKCQKCGHIWNYTGDSNFYGTCSSCLTKVPHRFVVTEREYKEYVEQRKKKQAERKAEKKRKEQSKIIEAKKSVEAQEAEAGL